MADVLDFGFRKKALSEILGSENKNRKTEALTRFEVYHDRQQKHVLDRLIQEFSRKTVNEMRKIFSINLTKRLVNEKASIYSTEPERTWIDATDQEKEHLNLIYETSKINRQLKQANRYLELFDQCTIKVIPKNGIIDVRVLSPNNYDVIPLAEDSEKAFAYVINTFDKSEFDQLLPSERASEFKTGTFPDTVNQLIADPDDYKKSLMRFTWWTDDFNFISDGNGRFIIEPQSNPIGRLPFIDVHKQKDSFEFWVRNGSSVVEFALDFALVLSDTANTNRLQNYAQAIIVGEQIPENIVVGPNHILRLPVDSTTNVAPRFEFVSPNADLAAALDFLETMLRLYLSSRGIDPKAISGKEGGTRFSSGIERLLSMVEKFEATKEDFDIFQDVEQELFKLLIDWNNVFQGVEFFKPELKTGQISENVGLEVKFSEPQVIQTATEKEDSVIKRLNAGLITKTEAIAELRDMDLESAKLILEEMQAEKADMANRVLGVFNGQERLTSDKENQSQESFDRGVPGQREPEVENRQ